MNPLEITDNNLVKLSDFLQLLEDQMNIDGYNPKSLRSRYVVLSRSVMENRGIVAEEARSMIGIINRINGEKTLGIVEDDLVSSIELKDRSNLFRYDSSMDSYYEEKYRKQKDKKIADWIRVYGKSKKIPFREDFDKVVIVDIFSNKKLEIIKKQYINKLVGLKKNKKSKIDLPTIFVNGERLWREPKVKYSYSMIEVKGRYKIFEYLSNNGDKYVETKNIAEQMGRNPSYIRSQIGKINRTFKNKLEIKINLIEASQGNGYRINPDLKIVTR